MNSRKYFSKRRYYSKKRLDKQMYAIILLISLIVIRNILIFIKENPIIILVGISALATGIMLKFYIDNQNRIKEEKSKQEYLRTYRTIKHLLNKFKDKPTEFEDYVAKIYDCLGFNTKVTKATADGGKDIVMDKDGIKYAVEVKLYSEGNKVGREKLQKLQGAMIDINADKGIFVTTSTFTHTALEYGKKHGIILVNGKSLVKLIDKALGEGELSNVNNEASTTIMFENLFE